MDRDLMAYLTDADRVALYRAHAATPGPWCIHRNYDGSATVVLDCGQPITEVALTTREANAAFIAHARTDVPALCQALAEARREVAALKAERAEMEWDREALHWLDEHTGTLYAGWCVRLPGYYPAENGVEVWKPMCCGPKAALGMSIRQAIAAAMRAEEEAEP